MRGLSRCDKTVINHRRCFIFFSTLGTCRVLTTKLKAGGSKHSSEFCVQGFCSPATRQSLSPFKPLAAQLAHESRFSGEERQIKLHFLHSPILVFKVVSVLTEKSSYYLAGSQKEIQIISWTALCLLKPFLPGKQQRFKMTFVNDVTKQPFSFPVDGDRVLITKLSSEGTSTLE